jgi:exodeoxyribonuclease-3
MIWALFVFFNVYFPNGQKDDERLRYKLDFYRDFFAYADSLGKQGRSLVITGDFNTAHNEIDLKNPKSNEKRSGFLRIERDVLDELLADGYVDTFRALYPDTVKYSWWSYRFLRPSEKRGMADRLFFCNRRSLCQRRRARRLYPKRRSTAPIIAPSVLN